MKSQRNWDCLIRFWSRAGRAFLPRRPDESAALWQEEDGRARRRTVYRKSGPYCKWGLTEPLQNGNINMYNSIKRSSASALAAQCWWKGNQVQILSDAVTVNWEAKPKCHCMKVWEGGWAMNHEPGNLLDGSRVRTSVQSLEPESSMWDSYYGMPKGRNLNL